MLIEIEGRVFQSVFIVIQNAKYNGTLLEMNVLHNAEVVFYISNKINNMSHTKDIHL